MNLAKQYAPALGQTTGLLAVSWLICVGFTFLDFLGAQ